MPRLVLALVAALFATAARADTVTVGGIEFQDNAFADRLVSFYSSDSGIFGGQNIGGVNPTSVEQGVVGADIRDFIGSIDDFSYVQLGFTDNILRNGPGADLALFEMGGVLDRFAAALLPSLRASDYREFTTAFTGTNFGEPFIGNRLNVALIDLSDFGVAEGSSITSITVGLYPLTTPPGSTSVSSVSLTVAAALYPNALDPTDPTPPVDVPAPPAVLLAGIGGLGLFGWRRMKPKG